MEDHPFRVRDRVERTGPALGRLHAALSPASRGWLILDGHDDIVVFDEWGRIQASTPPIDTFGESAIEMNPARQAAAGRPFGR